MSRMDYLDEMVLKQLEDRGILFPSLEFEKKNGQYVLLGEGGSGYVLSVKFHGMDCAMKITGFGKITVDRETFRNAVAMQKLLAKKHYAVRILAEKELLVQEDFDFQVQEVTDLTGTLGEPESGILFQFLVMERLVPVLNREDSSEPFLVPEELLNPDGKELSRLAADIGAALWQAHSRKFLHRDIKLDNIFWDPKCRRYKLGDFGISKQTADGSAQTRAFRTEGYCAPEVYFNLNETYDATSDLYSFGVVLYVIKNRLRFPASGSYAVNSNMQYAKGFVFPSVWEENDALVPLISKLVAYDPDDRFQSAKSFLNVLYEKDFSPETKALRQGRTLFLSAGTFSVLAAMLSFQASKAYFPSVHYPVFVHLAIACSVLRGICFLTKKRNSLLFAAVSVCNTAAGIYWLSGNFTTRTMPTVLAFLYLLSGLFPVTAMTTGLFTWGQILFVRIGRRQQWYQLWFQTAASAWFYRFTCFAIIFLTVSGLLFGKVRNEAWKRMTDWLCRGGRIWLIDAAVFVWIRILVFLLCWPRYLDYDFSIHMADAATWSLILCFFLYVMTRMLGSYQNH